ncbi:unnamed protein product [Rotaria sp. Silwood1]|nr:unnamed protein product [Rotaria sp. Silwood1]CAF1645188.1 unnamed protein product [Rotaria sp. Silwood1]CAF4998948.1 unnamed protein product [Rotaria sp. Silwood1]
MQTNDNDPQLNELTERIRYEIRGMTEWDKLGKLLIKIGQFDRDNELYEYLVDRSHNDREKIHFYHQLDWNKKKERKYEDAIIYYEESLKIKQKIRLRNPSSFAATFNDIGSVYEKMNKHTAALMYYEKALEIQRKILASNDLALASTLSRIGSIYEETGEYSKALSFHEEALEIRQK